MPNRWRRGARRWRNERFISIQQGNRTHNLSAAKSIVYCSCELVIASSPSVKTSFRNFLPLLQMETFFLSNIPIGLPLLLQLISGLFPLKKLACEMRYIFNGSRTSRWFLCHCYCMQYQGVLILQIKCLAQMTNFSSLFAYSNMQEHLLFVIIIRHSNSNNWPSFFTFVLVRHIFVFFYLSTFLSFLSLPLSLFLFFHILFLSVSLFPSSFVFLSFVFLSTLLCILNIH